MKIYIIEHHEAGFSFTSMTVHVFVSISCPAILLTQALAGFYICSLILTVKIVCSWQYVSSCFFFNVMPLAVIKRTSAVSTKGTRSLSSTVVKKHEGEFAYHVWNTFSSVVLIFFPVHCRIVTGLCSDLVTQLTANSGSSWSRTLGSFMCLHNE